MHFSEHTYCRAERQLVAADYAFDFTVAGWRPADLDDSRQR